MLIVVEGISAAGKTSWCGAHAPENTIPESGPFEHVPNRNSDARASAEFWVRRSVARWYSGIELERRTNLAVFDTDPLKIHYTWSLWKIGELSAEHWLLEAKLAREAIAGALLGFADVFLVHPIDPAHARMQREQDLTRSRRNFDLHVRLSEPLRQWYRELSMLLPGRVVWTLPSAIPARIAKTSRRDDLDIFDALMRSLNSL